MITFLYLYFFITFGAWMIRNVPKAVKAFPGWVRMAKSAIQVKQVLEASKPQPLNLTDEEIKAIIAERDSYKAQAENWEKNYFDLLSKSDVSTIKSEIPKNRLGAQ